MCSKLLCFYFKGFYFFLFVKARLWKCSAGDTWVLAQLCHQESFVSVPNSMGTLWDNSFSSFPTPLGGWATFHSIQSQGKWPKLCSTYLQPVFLHLVVPALLAWLKASGWRRVCTAFPLHLLFTFSGLKPAEQLILCHPAPLLWFSSLQQVPKAAMQDVSLGWGGWHPWQMN